MQESSPSETYSDLASFQGVQALRNKHAQAKASSPVNSTSATGAAHSGVEQQPYAPLGVTTTRDGRAASQPEGDTPSARFSTVGSSYSAGGALSRPLPEHPIPRARKDAPELQHAVAQLAVDLPFELDPKLLQALEGVPVGARLSVSFCSWGYRSFMLNWLEHAKHVFDYILIGAFDKKTAEAAQTAGAMTYSMDAGEICCSMAVC